MMNGQREVGQARSTDEVAEQRRATGGGGDGGKGPGQREPAPAKRAPDTEPGRRAQCAGAGTSSSKTGQEGAVHRAPAPRLRRRPPAGGVLRAEARRGPGSGRRDVASTTGRRWRANLQDLSERLQARGVPSEAGPAGVHPEGRRAAAAARASPRWRTRSSSAPTVEVLNAIYETDFLGFSYGFRPGRSQHHALDALYAGLLTKKVNWVLDADIRGFFDTIDHEWLVKFVEHRIADRRVVRLIQKWLNAGVLEDGKRTRSGGGDAAGRQRRRRCWPTSTCTTCSTSGSSSGGRSKRAAT